MNGGPLGWLRRGIRNQLIFAVAAVHAVMMALFVWDLVVRQQDMLLERQTEQAEALARTLATSAAGWLAARDVSGLQELADAQAHYPELQYAMLVDARGRILAHSERPRVGQFLRDLPARADHAVLMRTPALVDVASPALLGEHHVGWVRVGIGQQGAARKLWALTRDGLLYAFAAIVIGSLLAWLLGNRLTARLYAIRATAAAVRGGDARRRAPVRGDDEVAELARDFNHMLDVLGTREKELHEEKEFAHVTLASIGDGVVTTDADGRVTFLNPVAEKLTGWADAEARGLPIVEVMRLINEDTGEAVENPVQRCRAEGRVVGMANHTVLISRAGREIAIEDSAAPILDRDGAVSGVVMVFHDVSDKRTLTREMAWQLAHDSLTGLTNRREFERRLRELLQRQEPDACHAMLYLDLDQFKMVNDTCGHLAGDELLRGLAETLRGQLRGSDLLARLGGDEFGVLLENCPLEHAGEIAAKLLRQVRAVDFSWQGRRFEVGVSIGIAPIDHTTRDIAEVTSAADMACYAAKERGRNRVHVHAPDDHEMLLRRRELHVAGDIRAALEQDRLVLHAQEIRPLGGGHAHHEVLVRMLDAKGDIQPPAVFIPAAERYGLMPDVDRWVVRQAFAFLARAPELRLAINLSGLSLQDEGFTAYVAQTLRRYGIEAERVCFEITETAAISHLGRAVAFMREMKALGFCFSLDDFGTGMSSFAYLKNLPVDFLKIDGTFVRDMVSDPIDRAFVETINRIGQVMGMHTIAEFVENDAILAALREVGVDYAQGYGVAKPCPLETLAPLPAAIAV